MHNYYQGLIWMKNDQVEQGLKESKSAIRILDVLDYKSLAQLYNTLLQQFLEKENIQIV